MWGEQEVWEDCGGDRRGARGQEALGGCGRMRGCDQGLRENMRGTRAPTPIPHP